MITQVLVCLFLVMHMLHFYTKSTKFIQKHDVFFQSQLDLSNCIISCKDYKHYLKKTLIITVEPCPYVVVTLAPIYFNQEKET